MSPILVRPVREQLEHDRVIRLLQAKYKRKFEVAINPGHEQTAPVGAAPSPWYPDLVLHSTERGRRLAGIVEVETAESVNNLEAMSQWAAFAKQRAEFHLYVPAASIDVTRRLCADIGIDVTEIWAYHAVGDQLRFVLVQRAGRRGRRRRPEPPGLPRRPRRPSPSKTAAAKPPRTARSARRPANPPPRPVAARSGAAKNGASKAAAKKTAPVVRPAGRPQASARGAARNPLSRRPGAARPVPFLRVIRDKRGYETTYLMHWFSEGGRQRSRILYAFRGPSVARVGRLPLEPATMRHLEASFPECRVRLEGRDRRATGDRVGTRGPAPAAPARGAPSRRRRAPNAAARSAAAPPAERAASRFPVSDAAGNRRRTHGVSGRVVSAGSRTRGTPDHRRGAAAGASDAWPNG